MTRRRRSGAPGLVVISWRDIPAQVTATGLEGEAKAMLPSRFQKAIDKAARVAGLTDHRSYIGEWRRATVPLTGDDPQSAVDELVARLDAEHDRETLATLVRQGGLRQPDAEGGLRQPDAEEGLHQPGTDRSTLADDPGGRP